MTTPTDPTFTTNARGEPICVDCGVVAWECRCVVVRYHQGTLIDAEPVRGDPVDGRRGHR